MNLRKVTLKYACLVVFIHNDSAEIWGFRYGLKLFIGTLKIMASSVFSCVKFVLSHTLLRIFPHNKSMILTYIKHK